MRIALHETVHATGAKLDRENHVLRGVKILGLKSKNGRRYLPEAASNAQSLYEGASCNIDHPPNANQSRSFADRFGKIIEVRKDADGGLSANLKYNPKHPYAQAFEWWAENEPSAIGMSHNAIGEGRTEDGVFLIEKIVSVRSVDLVADPATTKGLYENMNDDLTLPAETDEGYDAQLGHVIHAITKDSSLSMEEKKKKIMALLKLMDDGEATDDATLDDVAGDDVDVAVDDMAVESVQSLKKKLSRYESKEKIAKAAKQIGLHESLLTEVFVESLVGKSDQQIRKLLEDRKSIAAQQSRGKAKSYGQGSTVTMDVNEFVRNFS